MTIIDQINQAHLQKRRTSSQDGGAVAFLLYQNQKNAARARQRNSVRYMLESFQKQIKYGNQIKSSHPRICILKINQRTCFTISILMRDYGRYYRFSDRLLRESSEKFIMYSLSPPQNRRTERSFSFVNIYTTYLFEWNVEYQITHQSESLLLC